MNLLDEDVTGGASHAFTFVVGDDGVVSPYVDGAETGFAVDEFPGLVFEWNPCEGAFGKTAVGGYAAVRWAWYSASNGFG